MKHVACQLAVVLAAIGASGCLGTIRGDLYARGPRAGYWSLSARKCTEAAPGEGIHSFVITGADGVRVGVSPTYERKPFLSLDPGWLVRIENITDPRAQPVLVQRKDCRVFDVADTPYDPGGHSGHIELDCTLESGDRVTAHLTFDRCARDQLDE